MSPFVLASYPGGSFSGTAGRSGSWSHQGLFPRLPLPLLSINPLSSTSIPPNNACPLHLAWQSAQVPHPLALPCLSERHRYLPLHVRVLGAGAGLPKATTWPPVSSRSGNLTPCLMQAQASLHHSCCPSIPAFKFWLPILDSFFSSVNIFKTPTSGKCTPSPLPAKSNFTRFLQLCALK